jgi:tetratricopeptide (TPR) repeat protein
MADQKPDEALTLLKPYIQDISDTGYRASWLASIIYIDKKQYDKAKAVIEEHPKLSQDPLGKEGLARIALLQGNTELADKLYAEIENQSAEALSYFARKAYAQKDWKKAQELTEKLVLLFPDNLILRANLNQILEESKKNK